MESYFAYLELLAPDTFPAHPIFLPTQILTLGILNTCRVVIYKTKQANIRQLMSMYLDDQSYSNLPRVWRLNNLNFFLFLKLLYSNFQQKNGSSYLLLEPNVKGKPCRGMD
jgi:hypothetical protein